MVFFIIIGQGERWNEIPVKVTSEGLFNDEIGRTKKKMGVRLWGTVIAYKDVSGGQIERWNEIQGSSKDLREGCK
jgi:hypothetical protein